MALISPRRLLSAALLAFRMGVRSDRPLVYHFAYLVEACYVRLKVRQSRASFLHAHFGTNSAEVAMLANVLGAPNYSFTIHGPEEFDKPQFIGLREKVSRCAFVAVVSSFGRSQLFRWINDADWGKV